MDSDDAAALARLVAAGGGSAARRALLDAHGSAAAAVAAGPAAWRASGLDATQVARLQVVDHDAVRRTGEHLSRDRGHLVGWGDPDYPPLLRAISSPPLALYVAGEPALLWHPAVAVVGSRAPTAGGRDCAREFAGAFARAGLGVTSGMAAGIDTAAHEAALAAGGVTGAVLGTGIDVPYPRANTALHARIAASGVVVSEHLPGTGPRREHFPSRNRILSGLSLATLVVEAAERSGALITARMAGDAGRDVFAVPGSIRNPKARGCHRLIRDGAGLVASADEVIALLGPLALALGAGLRDRLDVPSSALVEAPATRDGPCPGASPDYHRLWNALGHDPTGMDSLVERTGLTPAGLSSMLLLMELEGRVAVEHGRYSRKSCHHAPAGAGRGK